ncbi:hypothetical protein N0V82_007994 [Gnomoniopsis sp. IMI 355080]|nr:hypothetical protein N0V82_007994 [Gnomoniopsis sp. IMI 355080]
MDSLANHVSLRTIAATMACAALAAAEPLMPRANVSPQAGVIEGGNPVAYSASNPITLFIIQAIIVIIFCRILYWPLSYLGQPRVIAEVLGGILLGPSVMMRIPNFKDSLFPTESMPIFSNVANLGLIIFLFLVGLEVDVSLFTTNWRVALSVSLAGMALPFGLGVGIAWGLYHEFRTDANIVDIEFGVYALFIGTALAITAFPVLCRILTELNLLKSSVGVTVLAAGIGNDVVGWILLALCVALVNNTTGLAALYALLAAVGWALFLVYAVRPCFVWCLKKTGSLQKGPTQGMVALTLGIALISSWFTGIIGVHPIFGAFLAGLICPHHGGFAIKLTEKIEDLVSVLFLPLYFALSGLSTNLGLLNDGITWAYVIGVIAVAFVGKILGGTLAARLNKLEWRESFTIGCLMSCKGLVELIVLNIGLSAQILSDRTFTIFVVMALVTTVATTPLTKWLYPVSYQIKMEKWRRGEIDENGNPIATRSSSGDDSIQKLNSNQIRRLLVYLRLDSLPSLFTLVALLGAEKGSRITDTIEDKEELSESQLGSHSSARRPLEVHGLRILELTERTSSVMQVTEGEEYYSERDPVVNAFSTFSRLNDVAVAGRVAVVPTTSYAETLMKQAADVDSDFVLVPWSEYGSISEDTSVLDVASIQDRFSGREHLEFINRVQQKTVCNMGIFINNSFGGLSERRALNKSKAALSIHSSQGDAILPVKDKTHQIYFPFFGGVDDRVALRFALRLAKSPNVTLTIAHFNWGSTDSGDEIEKPNKAVTSEISSTDKNGIQFMEETSAQDSALLSQLQSSMPQELVGRVTIAEINVTRGAAVADAVSQARKHVGMFPKNSGDVVVVGRSHRDLGDHTTEVGGSELKKTIGVVAEQLIESGVKASLLVIKAGGAGLHW